MNPARIVRGRAPMLVVAWVLGAGAASDVAAQQVDLPQAWKLFESGQYDACAAAATEAIERDLWGEQWRVLKLECDLMLGRYPAAARSLDEALARYPQSIRLRWLGRQVALYTGQADRAAVMMTEIEQLAANASWRYSDAANLVVLGRFFLARGQDARFVLENYYDRARREFPRDLAPLLASGELALEKHDYRVALETYQEALKLDATRADVQFGLARALAPSNGEASTAALAKALELNPNHVPALLLVVDGHVDAERYDEADRVLERLVDINPELPAAWAYRAVLAHVRGKADQESFYYRLAQGWWSANPDVDHLIGRKLSEKYRFAEGAKYQRDALAKRPDHLAAKAQLCQDLLRLGEEEEGWRLAREVYDRDPYSVVAHNLNELHDRLTRFRTLANDHFVVRMDAVEAAIYGERVLELLERARLQLGEKYEAEIDGPVFVEIFPRQQDFAIRTFGLPGGAGFLGVCFGRVITANSPASRGDAPSNWESVLWHEYCHVVTLQKTRNKMPRWLSEGISVYEERQADPAWGQSMTPRYREMILGEDLTPVSRLSAAFLQPKSAIHLQFAYYESSLVVEYLVDTYGLDVLKRVLVDLSVGMPINESLARYTGSLEGLDQAFANYARERADSFAEGTDWDSKPDPKSTPQELVRWIGENPTNFWAQQQLALGLIAAGRYDQARDTLKKLIELHPTDTDRDSAYRLLAGVYRKLGETDAEAEVLEELAARDADAVDACLRLMELYSESESWEALARAADRMLSINPLVVTPHAHLARAAEHLDRDATALGAYRALLAMDPRDPAEVNYRVARLLIKSGNPVSARRHVLMALEEAPRFRAAHELLAEIIAGDGAEAAAPPRQSSITEQEVVK